MFERFGAEQLTFDLIGRVHLDYMQLYRKYTYEERHSYSLDAIGEYEEVGSKLAYEGTLDQLYNKDFEKTHSTSVLKLQNAFKKYYFSVYLRLHCLVLIEMFFIVCYIT